MPCWVVADICSVLFRHGLSSQCGNITIEMFDNITLEHRTLINPLSISWLVLKDLVSESSDLHEPDEVTG